MSTAGTGTAAVGRRAGKLPAPLVALVLTLVAACGVDGGGAALSAEDDGSTEGVASLAHPLEVGWVPDDYRLVTIGRGTEEQEWSPDRAGADEPFTVVLVDGVRYVASAAAWEPMESEFQWASRSNDPDPELFALTDGRRAAFGEGQAIDGNGGASQPNDLVVEVDNGTALVLAADGVDKATLVAVAEHIAPEVRRSVAPVVVDAPDDWEVVGSVQPDALIARRARVLGRTPWVPGPPSGYSIGYERAGVQMSDTSDGLAPTLAVMVLPGESADPAAFGGERFVDLDGTTSGTRELTIDGRPAFVVDGFANFGGRIRALFSHDESGALVVVTTQGTPLPSDEELAKVAESVRPVGAGEWDAAVLEAFGGADLAPDEGETEIARGVFGDIGWLLQTRTRTMESPTGLDTVVTIDNCLKLSTLRRVCASASTSGPEGEFLWARNGSPDFADAGVPPFVIVTSSRPDAVTARISWADQSVVVPLAPVDPGRVGTTETPSRAGVIDMELPEAVIPVCPLEPVDPPEGSGIVAGRIDLLDASGAAIGCLGMG